MEKPRVKTPSKIHSRVANFFKSCIELSFLGDFHFFPKLLRVQQAVEQHQAAECRREEDKKPSEIVVQSASKFFEATFGEHQDGKHSAKVAEQGER